MAKFGEKLFEFKETLKSSTIPVSCAGDQWYLNVGKNSVVNVHDQKTLHTWTLTHPHYFTCSVVHSNGNLYCAMDKNVLVKWATDEDNLKNAEKVKFQDSIFAIVPVNGANPIVIFDSGKFAVITSTFSDIKPSDFVFIKEDEELVWADACKSAKNIEVFCLVQNSKNKVLYNFTVNKQNNSEPVLRRCEIFRTKAVLKSWCLNHEDVLFLSLWSDGMICCHDVKESKDTNLLSIKCIQTDTVIDMDSIDSIHIAVGRSNSKEEGCVIEIWDSKCAVLKAQKVLKIPSPNYIQIAAMSSCVFLCFDKEVLSVPYKIEDATMCAALGMSESSKFVQHKWNSDLELVQYSDSEEPEAMDVDSNKDSLKSITERLMNNENSELISESELVKLLQRAIRCKKEENKEYSEEFIYSLLNSIFSAPFSDIILVKYLKRINIEETLIALDLLLSFLNHAVNVSSNVFEKPTDLQLVTWTCLIIQSHTEAFLFSKDKASQTLLKQLKKTLSAKMEEYEDFDCIQSYFSVIEKKNILPQKCSVGKYCVETLEI